MCRTTLKQIFFNIQQNKKKFEKTKKMFELNSLPSSFCSVRYAHTTKQTPRKKIANAIIWLCPPTTQSKKISVGKCDK